MNIELVVSVFEVVWFVGFIAGLAAAIGLFSLHKYGENVPFLLKHSGLSVFFPCYYEKNELRRKIVAMLMCVCVCCIALGFAVLFVGVPEFRAKFWEVVLG